VATDAILAPGFAARPYSWEAASPSLRAPEISGRRADVVIVGGGIAGLSAAIELARNGVRSLMLDREALGWSASSRNGGSLVGAPAL
jgi:gamma-glutamylputrescine oxidase